MSVPKVTLEPASNQATYIETFTATQNDVAIDFTGSTIEFAIRDPQTETRMLFADTSAGITISTTSFTVRFEESDMNTLDAKSYNVGCRYTLAGTTTQLFTGTLTIVDGQIEE